MSGVAICRTIHLCDHPYCKRIRHRFLGCLFDSAALLEHQKRYYNQIRDLLSSGVQRQCCVADYLDWWSDFAIHVSQGLLESCDGMVFILRGVELSFH